MTLSIGAKDNLVREFNRILTYHEINDELSNCIMSDIILKMNKYDVGYAEDRNDIDNIYDNEHLIELFSNDMRLYGKSEKTINQYVNHLKRFINTFDDSSLLKATSYEVKHFLSTIQLSGADNVTVKNAKSFLSSFYNWAIDNDYLVKNPVKSVRKIKYIHKKKEALSSIELDKMRSLPLSKRDRAIFEVFISSGVRLSECASLNISDIDFKNKMIILHYTKNKHERTVCISDVCAER